MDKDTLVLRQYFQNFIAQEKTKIKAYDEYINFLKILWFCFDNIVPKPKILRKIYLLEQIEKFLVDSEFNKQIVDLTLPDEIKLSASGGSLTPSVKLKEIDVVNFRGFQSNDDGKGRKIKFNDKATLFFAPNGGGKSSLCEAIEWSLTGDTIERSKRKVEGATDYYQNTVRNSPCYTSTKLILADDKILVSNPIYDRCFLEKNRIEKFAKLAIQPSADIQEILGELFGLSNVVDFFKEFGQDFSPSMKELEEPKRVNWQLWWNWNSKKIDQQKLVDEASKEEKNENDELEKILNGKSFDDKKSEIEEAGKKLHLELENLEKDYSSEFSSSGFKSSIKSFLEKIGQWEKYEKDILENAKELDFENLFQAASMIFNKGYKDNKCPLCDTPFKQEGETKSVITDPREKTKNELKKLATLTSWKNAKSLLEADMRGVSLRLLRDEWQKIQQNLSDDNWKAISETPDKPIIPEINFPELESKSEQNFKLFVSGCKTAFDVDLSGLPAIENAIKVYQDKRKETLKAKPKKELQIQGLREELTKLQNQNNNLLIAQKTRKAAEENLQKITEQAENADNFKKILSIYPIFHDSIGSFQSKTILQESADIDGYVTGFYKLLNLHDTVGEKIKAIHFPKNPQEAFCLEYERDISKTCNALCLLSEGHLKTLGLSALLSRAFKFSSPLLVFDDAINAIDSDHRDNLALLLSGKISADEGVSAFGDKWPTIDSFINNCQIIITSHDRFFDEKLANLFGSDKQKRYVLYTGAKGIDFCEKGTPANFGAKIDAFLNPDTQDIRSAIFYSRIWLEEILLAVAMTYRKPSTNKPIEFKNAIDSRTKQLKNPELNTIIDSLVSNLKNSAIQEQKDIATILEEISRDKDSKYPWLFEILNQESHYRRFDHIDISNAPTSQEVASIFNKIKNIHSLTLQTTN